MCSHLDSLAFLVLHILLHGDDRLPLCLDLELLRPTGRQSFCCGGDLHGGSKVQYGNAATTGGETRVVAETAELEPAVRSQSEQKNDAKRVSLLNTRLTSAILALSNQHRLTNHAYYISRFTTAPQTPDGYYPSAGGQGKIKTKKS